MLSRRTSLCLSVAFAVLLAAPSRARANGRFPSANQLVASPVDPNYLALRTTFGLLFSHDRGHTWKWICEQGVGYGGVEDPAIVITPNGVMVATFEGLFASTDNACSWSLAQAGQFADVALRPNDPHAALAITSKFAATGDGGEATFDSRVYSTTDDGHTWADLGGSIDPDVLVETIDVTGDGATIYVSGVRTPPSGDTNGALLVSTDNGAHYTEYPVDIDHVTERAPFIGAVDPTNSARVYVRIKGTNGDRLIVTDDGGKTFRTVLKFKQDMLGFALSPDGSKVYAGGPTDGIYMATRDALTFTQVSTIQLWCLATNGTTLFACSTEASGFLLGASEDDGHTFTKKLNLSCIRDQLACPSTASTSQCSSGFDAIKQSLASGIANVVCDGGVVVPPSGDAGDSPAEPSPKPGCKCNEGATGGGAIASGLAGLVALAALARRRRS